MITWIEVTEEHYYEMMGIVPPAFEGGGIGTNAFQVGEPVDHNEKGEPTFTTFKEEVRVNGSTKTYEATRPHTFREFKSEFRNATYFYE